MDPADGHIFFVHLGDIKDGKNTAACDESLFLSISQIFENVPFPTFFVPGDNGFLDWCVQDDFSSHFWPNLLLKVLFCNARTHLLSFAFMPFPFLPVQMEP